MAGYSFLPGLPVFAGLCTLTAILLVISSLVENKLVECNGGEWFGYMSMSAMNGTLDYSFLQRHDMSSDTIDSVAAYAWPAMALAISGLLFSFLMLVFLVGKSESWRFTLLMGVLAIGLFVAAATLSTVLVSHVSGYISSSTCTVGRDTYLLWAGCAVMVFGTRTHAISELKWGG